ncbi:hypothetical protein [Alcanivorax sp. S71-1-4]|uniref:hypothetical protein n=1 Tax=Alcanivorax sp. S71-1-4 TaxID=1177159 RepID=UPI00135755FB|nr:hypothetical protein [Alcanivorax sp. S71-1-4]
MQLKIKCLNVFFALLWAALLVDRSLAFNFEKGDSKNIHNGQFQDAVTASKLMAAQFYGMSGFVTLDEGDTYYAILRKALAKYDMNADKVVSSWPIKRWEDEYIEDEILQRYTHYNGGLEPNFTMTADAWEDMQGGLFGCLQNTPLRYGDFTGDGNAELIIITQDMRAIDFYAFSPDQGKVIFTSRLSVMDSAQPSMLEYDLENERYQHISYLGLTIAGREEVGLRAFAKLFTGHFLNAEQPGLIQWRKLYRSLPLEGDGQGFRKADESFHYYQLVDGVYKPQDVGDAIIREWMATNELTWQSGFPTYSECPGQESELIPEMHEQLLNDPDVLN